MEPCNCLKRTLLIFLVVVSIRLNGQESGKDLFDNASAGYSSFARQMKTDSVLSFRTKKGYFPSLLNNFIYQATFPVRMNEKDLFVLGGVTIITLSLIHYDQEIDHFFKPVNNDHPHIGNFSSQITDLGDYKGYILLAGYGIYTIGFHKYRGFRASLLASQAAITAGLWIRGIKILTGRMRPGATYNDVQYNSDHWFGPFAQFKKYNVQHGVADFDAFPSGHTGAIFAMATVFSELYKDYKAVPIIMYSTAGIVGISRLVQHEHWASDVFLGSVIGYLCGKQVVANEKKMFPGYSTGKKRTMSFIFPYNENGISGLKYCIIF